MSHQRALLVILDGWGIGPDWGGNAITQAHTPTFDALWRTPHARLGASGAAVGLPGHERGNSEVGHLNLGAGSVLLQDVTRISTAIDNGEFNQNAVLVQTFDRIRETDKTLHLIGLVSDASVHALTGHALALLQLAKTRGVRQVFIHAFTDGRDSDPHDGLRQLIRLEEACQTIGIGQIQSVIGRYWAMDRDQHWDRTAQAYNLIASGVGRQVASSRQAASLAYAKGTSDEFIEPTLVTPPDIAPYLGVAAGDAVVFWNFRSDRARQLAQAFTQEKFEMFPRSTRPQLENFITLTPYGAEYGMEHVEPAFLPKPITISLASSIAAADLRQYHIAETEKYAHVTYFFNGGQETPYPGQENQLIPSPKIATFDQQPEMSAVKITDALIHRIKKTDDTLLVANYANADMVGHTGNFHAALEAIDCLDREMRRLIDACQAAGIALIITADHGNVEQMVNPTTGEPATDHTTNPVPCYFILPGSYRLVHESGILADVAPTILHILNLPKPPTMEGESLLKI